MAECLFCRIAAGETAAQVVFSNEDCIAFLDHRPLFPGHCLLVPRRHVETLAEVPNELIGPLFGIAQLLTIAVETAMEAEGNFVAINNKISQSVPHLHIHIVPRRRKDGLRGFFWPRNKYKSEEDMLVVAQRIKSRLAELGVERL
ncbi:MAG TPA: HIT family protein [Pyrinomonadaceae bacterium]|nr:HIT family protein [Pyrinomonadaceae bacterium]